MTPHHLILDYYERHKHPVNATLHIIGVPAVVAGVYLIYVKQITLGLALIVAGYFLQYLGHKAQGNEVGEVTLIKRVWRQVVKSRTSE